ncbi:MAG: radical SAM protein [Phenylobacterium sp.]|uniref:B12-binding domain-containing radical SAM protein n=1 Tax=Phenylobacterium sp. TaxID=1871053 RepID=UPI00121B6564|nr:radical SAM protein [Phenylobacterium sp.]TAJ71335.1 MAG: radical SAM protein [Phenylobacterium sp.]
MKPVRSGSAAERITALNRGLHKALVIDLNNFSTFPTLAVGILVASLRNAGFAVELLSPLAYDVPAAERERAEALHDHLMRRIHLSTHPAFRSARDGLRGVRRWWLDRPHARVIAETERALAAKPDVLLLSAYMQHYPTVVELGKLAQRHGVPMLLGGPMFNLESAATVWAKIPGLTAVVGAETDVSAPDIVRTACEGGDLLSFPGITLPDGRRSGAAPPLRPLDATPVADFTDFPWDRYRVRIIPLMASRGCQWSRCTFCSDVVSVSGRTFRNRSADHVLHEMREQSRRHGTSNFLFLDLKLNSNPELMRGIVEGAQRNVRGAQWIGTVHVDQRRDNGLSKKDLRAAVAAGMRRVSFGLESGSQALLDAMDKGCSVEGNAEFIRNAHEAGLSVRATMFKGFPGETVRDLELTAEFLERHSDYIDRIRYNEFSIPVGTPIHRAVMESPEAYPNLRLTRLDGRRAQARYVSRDGSSASYRKAKLKVLRAVYAINRRPIRSSARAFDGLM